MAATPTTTRLAHPHSLPQLTAAQQKILTLIYTYRFLDRRQIQAFLHHKDHKHVNAWLKCLYEGGYLGRIYGSDPQARTRPAVYYLAPHGIRSLKQTDRYPAAVLQQRYRERLRRQSFIDRCLLVADCVLTLESLESDRLRFDPVLPSEYGMPNHVSHYLAELHPSLAFVRYDIVAGSVVKLGVYLLEVIDPTLPQYRFRKRLADYVSYLLVEEWIGTMPVAPTVLMVCPDARSSAYARRRAARLLAYSDFDNRLLKFTTVTELKRHSLDSAIWRRVDAD